MSSSSMQPNLFERFQKSLDRPDIIEYLRKGLIGDDAYCPGLHGAQKMIYADYVASGRALRQIENYVTDEVLPYYANSHTEASFCGQMMTRLRQKARQTILKCCGGDHRYDVIFAGSGATAGINRLVGLLDLSEMANPQQTPLVLIGPYEHHSNILPWRESGAEVIEIPEAPSGGPDIDMLEKALKENQGRRLIGAFSAMSNVTGIITDVKKVTRLLKSYGAISIWDFAGGAPYMPIDLAGGTEYEIDAIVVSTHKFIGGPGASGILVLRREAFQTCKPTLPGGGTVRFVSPWNHDYSENIITREEAGTPNVIGDIRAALCFLVKDAIGQEYMSKRLGEFCKRANLIWSKIPGLEILGNPVAERMPIFSFTVTDPYGEKVHQQLVTRMLSDLHGIQARGGCACTGPYAHRLLGIDHVESDKLRADILAGNEIQKPGWTRLGFSVLMTDEKADRIINAVVSVAQASKTIHQMYRVDKKTARFTLGAA